MLHPPVSAVEKLCVPLLPKCIYPRQRNIAIREDGTAIAYDYYRLTKSYIDKDGKTKHRSVLCLRELPSFDKDERNLLAFMLTTMIEDGQGVMCENKKLYEEAMSQYVKYRGSKYAQENDPRLIAERKAREEEERKKAVAVKLETLTQHEARIIGCENSRYACRWVRLRWMENPSGHSWWIVTQRVPRNVPCMIRHANVTRRDWKLSKKVFLLRAEPRNVTQ